MRVGIISVSDKRPSVHASLSPYISECENKIKTALESACGAAIEVVTAPELVNKPSVAKRVGRFISAQGVDCVILNIPIFSFPSLTLCALQECAVPCIIWTLKNPAIPGLVGMMANSGYLHSVGVNIDKVWGSEDDPESVRRIIDFVRSAHAAMELRGEVFGCIGGRSIGMGTGAVNPIEWQKVFGVDTDHVDQLEIIRRAELVDKTVVEKGYDWIMSNAGKVSFDGNKLSPESLRQQIRFYCALREIVEENEFSFIGIKCHYELSAYYATPCLAISMLNDPYDFDGKKKSVCCSCEADADGALSMRIISLISGQPSFLVDTRHYDSENNIFTLCNCGSVASWLTARSDDPAENLSKVELCPIIPKYKGVGCHTRLIVAPGEMTFARLTWNSDHYKMVVFKGESIVQPMEKLNETTPQWPHMFIKLDCDAKKLFDVYDSNHVHGAYGDYVGALEQFCRLKKIEFVLVS